MADSFQKSTIFLAILAAVLWWLVGFGYGILLSWAITLTTVLYHFAMRLLVGASVNAIMRSRANYLSFWFRPRSWESRLYRFLHIRKWKRRLPSYAPEQFDRSLHSLNEIAQAGCQAELVHEIIIPLSFLPLLAARYAGAWPVFFITSILAAALDLSFVLLQRYNRPRLLALMERQSKNRQR